MDRDEALANGPEGNTGTGGIAAFEVVVGLGRVGTGGIALFEVEVLLEIEGIGLDPEGLTVACILASELAVGAYNLDDETEFVGRGRG